MVPTSENFDISWNNFESRLSRSFADIWGREQFLDVTLAAEGEDGSMEALRAHKGPFTYDVNSNFSSSLV